jgi:hypothetical protein
MEERNPFRKGIPEIRWFLARAVSREDKYNESHIMKPVSAHRDWTSYGVMPLWQILSVHRLPSCFSFEPRIEAKVIG